MSFDIFNVGISFNQDSAVLTLSHISSDVGPLFPIPDFVFVDWFPVLFDSDIDRLSAKHCFRSLLNSSVTSGFGLRHRS
jgi:hypothetical protein